MPAEVGLPDQRARWQRMGSLQHGFPADFRRLMLGLGFLLGLDRHAPSHLAQPKQGKADACEHKKRAYNEQDVAEKHGGSSLMRWNVTPPSTASA